MKKLLSLFLLSTSLFNMLHCAHDKVFKPIEIQPVQKQQSDIKKPLIAQKSTNGASQHCCYNENTGYTRCARTSACLSAPLTIPVTAAVGAMYGSLMGGPCIIVKRKPEDGDYSSREDQRDAEQSFAFLAPFLYIAGTIGGCFEGALQGPLTICDIITNKKALKYRCCTLLRNPELEIVRFDPKAAQVVQTIRNPKADCRCCCNCYD